MFKTLRSLLIGFSLAVLAAVSAVPVQAATANYPLGTQVSIIPFHISGQYTASTTAVVRFTLPYKAKLIGVSSTARASGGTSPTLTVDVKSGGTTVLSTPTAITAGTVAESVITVSTLADEASITVDLAITGTSPTWNDITILLTVVRL